MLNNYPDTESKRQELEQFVKSKICEKWHLSLLRNVRFIHDSNPRGIASIEPLENGAAFNLRLEPRNIANLCNRIGADLDSALKCIAIHECFHIIFPELNQTNAFKLKDQGNNHEYIRTEQLDWDFVIKYFREFESTVGLLRKVY